MTQSGHKPEPNNEIDRSDPPSLLEGSGGFRPSRKTVLDEPGNWITYWRQAIPQT
jgi:hypothetical protein